MDRRSRGRRGEHVSGLLAAAGAGPVTIADGHHRYETALRYRDERRMSRSCEEDPAFDYLLMLFLETTAEPLTVLPTHRLVRGLGADGPARLRDRPRELFESGRPGSGRAGADLRQRPGRAAGPGGFGLWTRDGGSILTARRDAFAAGAAPGSPRRSGSSTSGCSASRSSACSGSTMPLWPAASGSPTRSRSPTRSPGWTPATDGADAAFLLEPTPVASITAVAASGEVMPQKSTYFYPEGPDRARHQPA